MDNKKIADLLFPDLKLTEEEIFKKYPRRNLNENQIVTRFAPSPTGFMHIGNFFQAFISYNLAKNSNGVLFLRIEDTDEKREIKEAKQVIYDVLGEFGIKFDEYQTLDGQDIGNYGPYVQSQRKDIYKVFAKRLVEEGKAFPCFCKKTEGKSDVLKLRETKFLDNDDKEYDPCRDLSYEEVKQHLDNGESFAIRLKTKHQGTERIKFNDLIKGELEANANAKDFVILKSDGTPPYAFAHAIDDTLMGTTIVVRGEEYISSAPSHLELFDALDFKPITYCHNPLIYKLNESGNRRKISKRYDPESNMLYYLEEGYPNDTILEYLLNMINSGFEIWRRNNPDLPWQEFKFTPNDITTVAPIFDLVKLNDISKNIIARMSGEKLYENWLIFAEKYDEELATLLKSDREKFVNLCKMDRDGSPKPRKDIYNYKMMKEEFNYIFDRPSSYEIASEDLDKANELLKEYVKDFSMPSSNEEWFNGVKVLAEKLGYAVDNKLYKQNPENYKGNVAKACEFIRVAITGKKNSPTLYTIMTILGEEEVKNRLQISLKND
ncbi:MAG: glutamate--tRNA ligase [Clostridia bacterium]|nr:glutamate--tRNA ligase [Clostridia bacterium]